MEHCPASPQAPLSSLLPCTLPIEERYLCYEITYTDNISNKFALHFKVESFSQGILISSVPYCLSPINHTECSFSQHAHWFHLCYSFHCTSLQTLLSVIVRHFLPNLSCRNSMFCHEKCYLAFPQTTSALSFSEIIAHLLFVGDIHGKNQEW